MVHHNVCPLCSSEQISLHLSCTDSFISRKDFVIFKCSACGFLFTQDYPDESEIGSYYESDDYISHSDTSEGLSNKLYRIARRFMLGRKKDLIHRITGLDSGDLLDIGCGTGHFASTMKKAGWRVKGIEINEKARNFGASHFGLDVIAPDKISGLESNNFDSITLWHVLEHFHNPFNYASEIYRLLKPGAFCIVALPNSSSYDSDHYNRYWAAWDVPRHLWHFSPSTFRVFSEKTGFITDSIRMLPLDVFYISLISEKYKRSTVPFIYGFTKAIIFSFLTLFNKRKSSSVIYILRKPVN
jgi:SAM-dependent methyltransferase